MVVILILSTSAFAQATRTWVSGVGDDVNPCSRTAPCKTWAGAISKTAPGGEIDALDSGGFGNVTVTKSITLDGNGVEASSLNTGGVTGVIINAASITVNLRNLSINGAGTGGIGVRILNSTHVNIQRCVIFGGSKAISLEQTTATNLNVEDSKIFQETQSAVVISPGGTNIKANFTRVSISNNGLSSATSDGIFVQNATAMLKDCVVSQNTLAGVEAGAGGNVFIDNSDLSNNLFEGIRVSGGTVRLSRSTMTNNANGATNVLSGTLFTFGDNRIGGNPVNNGAGLTAASPGLQ